MLNSSLDFGDDSDPPSDILSLHLDSEPESYYGSVVDDNPITVMSSQVFLSGDDEKPIAKSL